MNRTCWVVAWTTKEPVDCNTAHFYDFSVVHQHKRDAVAHTKALREQADVWWWAAGKIAFGSDQ